MKDGEIYSDNELELCKSSTITQIYLDLKIDDNYNFHQKFQIKYVVFDIKIPLNLAVPPSVQRHLVMNENVENTEVLKLEVVFVSKHMWLQRICFNQDNYFQDSFYSERIHICILPTSLDFIESSYQTWVSYQFLKAEEKFFIFKQCLYLILSKDIINDETMITIFFPTSKSIILLDHVQIYETSDYLIGRILIQKGSTFFRIQGNFLTDPYYSYVKEIPINIRWMTEPNQITKYVRINKDLNSFVIKNLSESRDVTFSNYFGVPAFLSDYSGPLPFESHSLVAINNYLFDTIPDACIQFFKVGTVLNYDQSKNEFSMISMKDISYFESKEFYLACSQKLFTYLYRKKTSYLENVFIFV